MKTDRLLMTAAFSVLVLGAQTHAAPGGGGNQAGGKPKTEQAAKSMERAETKTREQIEQSNPARGEQAREHSEKTNQARQDAPGKGEATSAEMQARQQERKDIQEQYRSTEQTGEKAKKKPWWKFWEEDAG